MDTQLKKTVTDLFKGLPKPIADQVKSASVQYLSKLEFSQIMFEPLDDIFKMKSIRYGVNQVSKSATNDTRFLYSTILTLINGIIAQLKSRSSPVSSSKCEEKSKHSKKGVVNPESKATKPVSISAPVPKVPEVTKSNDVNTAQDDETDGNVAVCANNAQQRMELEVVINKPKSKTQERTTVVEIPRSYVKDCALDRRKLINQSLMVSNFTLGRWDDLPPSPLKCSKPIQECVLCCVAVLSSRFAPCGIDKCKCLDGHLKLPNNRQLQKLHDRSKATEFVKMVQFSMEDFNDVIPPILADTYFQMLNLDFISEQERRTAVLSQTLRNLQDIVRNAVLVPDHASDDKSSDRSRSSR